MRNVGQYIRKGLADIDRCGAKFRSYVVILYENDSTDDTRSILERYKKKNYHYIFENDVQEPLRTMRLAHGRNKVLNHMRQISHNYDYFVVLDMDDVNQSGTFVDSIDTCFAYEKDWAVLTANQTGMHRCYTPMLCSLFLSGVIKVPLYHYNHVFSLINMYLSFGNAVTQKCIVGLPVYWFEQ